MSNRPITNAVPPSLQRQHWEAYPSSITYLGATGSEGEAVVIEDLVAAATSTFRRKPAKGRRVGTGERTHGLVFGLWRERFASASKDGGVQVFLPRRLAVVLCVIATLALSAPVWGDTTFTISVQRTIQVPPDSPRTHASVITAVSIHPAGNLVAAAGDDHVIRIWNLEDGSLSNLLKGHRDWIRAVRFSPDGKSLVSAGSDRRVLLWNVATGQLIKELVKLDHAIETVVFSHSGRWIAMAGFESKLHILDTSGNQTWRELDATCCDIRALAISSDDRFLAAAGRDGVVRIWDLQSNQRVQEKRLHQQRIRSLIFAQQGTQVISGGEDRVVQVWNWKTDGQVTQLPRTPSKIMAIAVCGSQVLATAGTDNIIRLWNLTTREELGELTGHTGSIAALDYRNGTLVSGGFDTLLRVWKVPTAISGGIRSAQRTE